MMNSLEIGINNKKKKVLIFFCVLSILLGLIIWLGMDDLEIYYFGLEINKSIFGAALIGLNLLFIMLFIFKLNKKFKLILNDQGMIDEMSNNSVGLIKWDDIIGVDHITFSNQKLIAIKVKNPEVYIARVKGLKKKIMQSNQKKIGAAIIIPGSNLEYNYLEIIKMIENKISVPNK